MALDADNDLVAQLTAVTQLVQAAHERGARAHGVSPTLARLLGLLRDRAPTLNELAALLALDKSSASGLVDRAQRRGLVRRVPSQVDRRAVRVRLTEAGRELAGRLDAGASADLAVLLAPLDAADASALSRYLGAILAAQAHL